jgi:hypothetical protein
MANIYKASFTTSLLMDYNFFYQKPDLLIWSSDPYLMSSIGLFNMSSWKSESKLISTCMYNHKCGLLDLSIHWVVQPCVQFWKNIGFFPWFAYSYFLYTSYIYIKLHELFPLNISEIQEKRFFSNTIIFLYCSYHLITNVYHILQW